jgi:hypothetical protein
VHCSCADISQYIAPLMLDLCDEEFNEDQLLIPAIRSLACLDLLARLHVHTSDTLSLLKDQVQHFGRVTKVFIALQIFSYQLTHDHQAIRESEAFMNDKKLSFRWPKMHSLAHLVDSIRRRGVTSNSSTDGGEALHPQNRKYYGRSNHQVTALGQVSGFLIFSLRFYNMDFQMLHMEVESEVIRKLRYQVDNWDDQQDLSNGLKSLSKRMGPGPHPHIWLCSPDARRTTISAYSITISREHGITDFLKSLSMFLEVNDLDSDLDSYEVWLTFTIFLSWADRIDFPLSLMSSHL